MSNKTIRIHTTPDQFKNNYLKVKLEQDFDFLEILSLNISQEEVYKRFCSDYGVVVGRVIVNNGVGVPNAKISIFIPLDDTDIENDEIRGLYPFENITDKDDLGKRYNLLPKSSQFDCHTPVGTMATKREILDNDLQLDIHTKYYKYTATTNSAGDFMIFGIPVGTHFINIDCDLSDIGVYSQRPYDFMAEGQPKARFESSNKFKYSDDLNKLSQIKNEQTSIIVRPFWGDEDQCSIGISRLDVDLKYDLKPSAIFMGSIFGDNEKNSINKRCKPRKKIGQLCETIAGAGSIEMLRKDLDGNNQRFDVEGGRLIDEDGVWAYQVPMNLDYMVTNEYGDLVPSADPSKGIPTRANVRFRIGMDSNGGEGRLRTRALYLVPHNPDSYQESDYSFDESTGSGLNGFKHFHDIYWNKIYSIKNFIPRFQTFGGLPKVAGLSPDVDVRSMIGIKDVDDCTGVHNPFPFNRMDSDINPLFTILCVIIQIISFLVTLINGVVLTLINSVISILNSVLRVICDVVFFIGKLTCSLKYLTDENKRAKCRNDACIGDCNGSECDDCNCKDLIPYIPCITMECQNEKYGPGCVEGSKPLPWAVTDKPPMKHWPDDGHPSHGTTETSPIGDAGWAYCISATLAEALDVWEFDFYNDWINGSLYSFLLKYKKVKRGKEKFCEYDCDDFGGGVDGNNDEISDNKCHNNWLVDSCTADGVKTGESVQIKDGLVKSYNDDLYYAAFTHEAGYKLFATDIIELGAIFDCDWQGKPKIQQYLVPTSYKAPELLPEYDDSDPQLVVTSGYDSPSRDNKYSLFFDVSCLGLNTSALNCENIKRQCEIGVGLNEDRVDESSILGTICEGGGSGAVGTWDGSDYAYPTIDNCDIDFLFIRDAFIQLNNPLAGIDYNSTNQNNHALFDATAYNIFRNYTNQTIKQPRGGSLYFYFGLNPSKTALDKMNSKYFESCSQISVNDFIISGNITDVTTYNGNDGSINISIIGGTSPYTYIWSNGMITEDITNLSAGNYIVTVTDAEGLEATQTFSVSQPFAVNCFASPVPVSMNGVLDGSINIVGIGGGTGPYTTSVTGPYPSLATMIHTNVLGPTDIFTGLGAGIYTVTTIDSTSQSASCTTTDLIITSPPPLVITGNSTNITCYGGGDGSINLNYITGVSPVTWLTTKLGYSSTLTNQMNLPIGTYNITATDGIGQTQTISFTINQPSDITAVVTPTHISCNGAADGIIDATSIAGGNGTYTYSWDGPTPNPITYNGTTLQPIGTIAYPAGTYTLTITDYKGCSKDFSVEILEPPVLVINLINNISITCNGNNDGQITIQVSGGNPNIGLGQYEVRIDGGTWQPSPTGSYLFTGLSSGNHTIDARDTYNNCTATPIIVSTSEPTIVDSSNSYVVGSSPNATIVGVGVGGNGAPYTYSLDNITYQSGPFINKTSGSYMIYAKDNMGCISSGFNIVIP